MDDSALTPVKQQQIVFYGDVLTVAVVQESGAEQVYIPLRPICDYLGVDWAAQRQRILRDAVLNTELKRVVITTTDSRHEEINREMSCLPLDFLNGWLFGLSAARVREEIRERLVRYQRECYRALANTFLSRPAASETGTTATLLQVREMGLAIARMAEEQIEFEHRLTHTEQRLSQAAVIVGDIDKRLMAVEKRLSPAERITEDQASQVSQAVKAVALALGKKSGRNEFGAVYGELYRKFGITGYKMLSARRFDEAMKFLTDWHEELTGAQPF